MEFFLSLRSRFADLPRILCCLPAVERRIRPPPVTLNRFAAARFVFIFGIPLPSLLDRLEDREVCFGRDVDHVEILIECLDPKVVEIGLGKRRTNDLLGFRSATRSGDLAPGDLLGPL